MFFLSRMMNILDAIVVKAVGSGMNLHVASSVPFMAQNGNLPCIN